MPSSPNQHRRNFFSVQCRLLAQEVKCRVEMAATQTIYKIWGVWINFEGPLSPFFHENPKFYGTFSVSVSENTAAQKYTVKNGISPDMKFTKSAK